MYKQNIQNCPNNALLKGRMRVHLEHDRLVYAIGTKTLSVSLWDISFVRLNATTLGQLSLSLEAIDGTKIALRWSAKSASASGISTLAVNLITRVSQRNQFATFSIGPSQSAWVIAWIGVMMSAAVIIGMTWAGLSGQGVPTVTLPLALSPVVLFAAVPIILNGPNRSVGLQQLVNALLEHEPSRAEDNR
jgi:hypothetical protein